MSVKIVQITSVVENYQLYDGNTGANLEATIYGLSDEGRMYYWGRTKTTKVDQEMDEEGNTFHYEHEYGWMPYLL